MGIESSSEWNGTTERRLGGFDPDWRENKGKIISDSLENKQMIQKVLDKQTDILLAQVEMKLEIKNIVNKNSFWTSSLVSFVVATIGGVITWWLSK